MALSFPGWAEPIEWLVGADWPHGNEDLMREMGRDLDDVAKDIRALIPDLDGIISGLKEIYPEGSGGEKIVAWMQPLRDSADGNHGSLEKFAANYELLSQSADSMGDQLEAAKLNFYISFGWVLAELALAAMSGPVGWFSSSAIFATARAAFRVIANTLFGRIAAIIARIAGGRITEAMVKRVLMEGLQEALVETLQGTSQELLVQTIQKQSGNIDGYNWDAVWKNAAVSAVAGGAGGLTGGLASLRFDTRMGGRQGALNGAVVGGLGGLGGAVAAGLVTGEFDPRSLTGGIFSGAGPGAIRGFRGSGTVAVNLDRMPTAPTLDGAVPTVEPITAEDPAATSTDLGQAGDTKSSGNTPQSTHPASSSGDQGNGSTDSPKAGDPSAARSTESEPVNSAPPAADTRRDGDTREGSEESGAPRDTTGTTQATNSPSSDGPTQSTGDTGPADRGSQDKSNTVDTRSGSPDTQAADAAASDTRASDTRAQGTDSTTISADNPPDTTPASASPNGQTPGALGSTAPAGLAGAPPAAPTSTASPGTSGPAAAGTQSSPSAPPAGTATGPTPNASSSATPSTSGSPAAPSSATPGSSTPGSSPSAQPPHQQQPDSGRTSRPDGVTPLDAKPDGFRPPVTPSPSRAGLVDTATISPFAAAPQAISTGIAVDPAGSATDAESTPEAALVAPVAMIAAGTDAPRTSPRMPWDGRDIGQRGTASPVGEFHGDARPADQPDLDTAQLLTAISENLLLITPETVSWNRDGGHFVLSDGRRIHLTIAATVNGAVAQFGPAADGDGYEVRVSPRARTSDVPRALAHELAEIALSLDPDIDIDPVTETPTTMTTHLGGRFAELRVLLSQIDRATFDPARAAELPALRRDLADLSAHLDLDDPAGSRNRDLLRGHDPRLAERFGLEQHNPFAARPAIGPDTDLGADTAPYDARLALHLDGEHADSLRRMENAGLQGRIREELARRVFDPLFTGPDAKAARATVPTRDLLSALDPINAALNDTTTTEAQRARAVSAAIDGFRDAMPQAFRDTLGDSGFQRMFDAAADLANHPRRITAELDQNAGTVTVDGDTVPLADFLRDVDRANRGATDLGVDVEYTVVLHDPVDGRSAVEILPRPRPQHRLPLPQNVFGEDDHRIAHQPRPAASATAAGAHTIDVGVGRSAFGVEMTPAADRADGGLIIKTELASEFPVAAQRRRDRGILDPGPLTAPGTVMVFGDLLFNGGALAHGGSGTVGRVFINNVSAKFTRGQYDALAAQLVRSLAPGGRVELQWDTKPESENGYVNDRGHIDGDQLFAALQRLFPDTDLPFRVQERTEFPPPGNSDYDYTIDAGGSNVLNRQKMAEFSAPRPDHRMVIVYEPAGAGVPSEHRGAAAAVGDFHGHARPADRPDLTDRQLHAEIENNLDLIDPYDGIRTPEPGHLLLPDGTPIRVRVAPTADNAVATFERTEDGYDVLVSPRARTEDIPRAIAHEVAEMMLAQQPSIDIDPVSERPAAMTAHLGGRFAELRVLLTQIERAAADPALDGRLPALRHDLADLAGKLGLSGRERSAAAGMLLARFDPSLADRLHAEIPADPVTPEAIEQVHGIPKRNQQILWDYAKHHNLVLFVRPTNPDAVRHLLRGAVPKPMAIKDKTVNDLDITLGAKKWSKGLVGRFPPGFLAMPDTTGMEQSEIDALRNRLATREQDWARYEQSMDGYAEKGRFRTTADGVVEALVDGRFRAITGDHDLFDIRRPGGDPLTPAELAQHENALIELGAGVQHGPHAYWDPPDTYQRVRNFESIIDSHQPDLDPQTKNEPLIVFAPGTDQPGMAFADRTAAAIDRIMTPWHVRSALNGVRGDTAALHARVDELANRPDFDHRDYQTWISPGARTPIAIDVDGDLVPFMAISRGPGADPALVRTGTPAHELAAIRRNAQPDSTPARIVQAVTDARTPPQNLPRARDTTHALEMARDLLHRDDGVADHDPAARTALTEELTRDTDTFDPAAHRAWSGDGARVAIVVDAGHRPVVRMAIVGPDGEIGFHDTGTPAHLLSILQEDENTDVPLDRDQLAAIAANRYPRADLPAARSPEHAMELARYILGLNEPHDHMAVPVDPGPKVIADLSDHPDGVTRNTDGLITHIGNRPIQEVVDTIARDRADKFTAARATPDGESGAQATARVKRWQDKGIHVNHKSHGKVSAVVADLRTGVVYEGFNGRNTDTLTVDDTHPTIERNVDAMRRLGQLMPDGGYPRLDRRGDPEGGSLTRPYPHFDSPYGHAEVKAANEALWARAALEYDDSPAAMAELYSQTYSLVPEKDADGNPLPLAPKPYCANCHGTMGSATNHSGRYPRYPHDDDGIIGVYTPPSTKGDTDVGHPGVPEQATPEAAAPSADTATTNLPSDHRGAAAAVGEFHGHARPDDRPDLTDRQLHTEIENNLDLIDPHGGIRTAEPGHYLLPDGTPVRVRVAPTADNAVATFERTEDGYDVLVSPRARTEDIPRAIAHEFAEIVLAQQDSIDADTVDDQPTTMTAHLGGRFAELGVLLTQIERAATDRALASHLPALRRDLTDLADTLGLHDPDRSATTRALLHEFDASLVDRADQAARAALIDRLTAVSTDPDGVRADEMSGVFDPAAYRAWSGDGARVAMYVEVPRVESDRPAGTRAAAIVAIVGADGRIGLYEVGAPAHLLSILEQNPAAVPTKEHLLETARRTYPQKTLIGARSLEHALELARRHFGLTEPHDHAAVPLSPDTKVLADLTNHPDGGTRDADGLITHLGDRPIQEVVDAIARDRATKFLGERTVPAGESAEQQKARQSRWQRKGIQLSPNSYGKVSAVVVDRRTGIVYEGFNGSGKDTLTVDDTHATIEHNVEEMRRKGRELDGGGYPNLNRHGELEDSSPVREFPQFDSPYGHAEVKAANEALWARTALGLDDSPAAMAELYSQTYSLVPTRNADGDVVVTAPKPYCANCHGTMGQAANYSGRYPRYPHNDDEITGAYTPSPAHPSQDSRPAGPDADATARTTRHPVGDPALQRHPVEDPEPDDEEEEEGR